MTCTRVVIEGEEKDAIEVRLRKGLMKYDKMFVITAYLDFEGRRIQNPRFGDDSNFPGSVDGVW